MPAKAGRLTPKQLEEARYAHETLEKYLGSGKHPLAAMDNFRYVQYDVRAIILAMNTLGIRDYAGYTLVQARLLDTYLTEIYQPRRTLVSTGHSYELGAGLDHEYYDRRGFPGMPSNFEVRLSLGSYDSRRVAECYLSLRRNSGGRLGLAHTTQRVSWPYDDLLVHYHDRYGRTSRKAPKRYRDCRLDSRYCRYVRKPRGNWPIAAAFESRGLPGLWQMFDEVWAESILDKPCLRPLSPSALEIRYWLYAGTLVRVVLANREVVGRLVPGSHDSQRGITRIWVDTAAANGNVGAHKVAIQAAEVFEIVPCQPDVRAWLSTLTQ